MKDGPVKYLVHKVIIFIHNVHVHLFVDRYQPHITYLCTCFHIRNHVHVPVYLFLYRYGTLITCLCTCLYIHSNTKYVHISSTMFKYVEDVVRAFMYA